MANLIDFRVLTQTLIARYVDNLFTSLHIDSCLIVSLCLLELPMSLIIWINLLIAVCNRICIPVFFTIGFFDWSISICMFVHQTLIFSISYLCLILVYLYCGIFSYLQSIIFLFCISHDTVQELFYFCINLLHYP